MYGWYVHKWSYQTTEIIFVQSSDVKIIFQHPDDSNVFIWHQSRRITLIGPHWKWTSSFGFRHFIFVYTLLLGTGHWFRKDIVSDTSKRIYKKLLFFFQESKQVIYSFKRTECKRFNRKYAFNVTCPYKFVSRGLQMNSIVINILPGVAIDNVFVGGFFFSFVFVFFWNIN